MSDRPPAVEVGRRTTELVLAIRLVDDYTDGLPIGQFEINIKGIEAEPIRNPSGYYLLLARADNEMEGTIEETIGKGSVLIVEEVGGRYLPERYTLTVDDLPVVELRLTPAPAYSFPGLTAVRGLVLDGERVPLAAATVSATGTDRTTRSDSRGEFVLPLDDLNVRTVIVDSATVDRFVTVNGADPTVTVVRPGGDPNVPADRQTETRQVPVGRVWSIVVQFT